jgi:hypothetical protein
MEKTFRNTGKYKKILTKDDKMTTIKAISGNPYKDNGATVINGGTVDSSNTVTSTKTISEISGLKDSYGSKVVEAVSTASSGNLGTLKANSSAAFAYQMVAGEYVAKIIGTKVAGLSNTVLRSGAGDFGHRRPIARWEGYNRLDITDWSYTTGAATLGGASGARVLPSGIDGTTGPDADDAANPSFAIPGELVYMVKGSLPTQDDYKAKYSH